MEIGSRVATVQRLKERGCFNRLQQIIVNQKMLIDDLQRTSNFQYERLSEGGSVSNKTNFKVSFLLWVYLKHGFRGNRTYLIL